MFSRFAGFTIFGILGHLAHELGTDDIDSVVNGGPGLAFISYPEAIARFDFAPQVAICTRFHLQLLMIQAKTESTPLQLCLIKSTMIQFIGNQSKQS